MNKLKIYQIHASTPGLAWLRAIKGVASKGSSVKDGDKDLKELLQVFVSIENPFGNDYILEKYADPTMIDWMKKNFLETQPVLNWGYSYGQRFAAFDGIDQIQNTIAKLRKNPESKSATITLMDPKGDMHHMPCIVAVDFKIRNKKLQATAFFRSQDAGKKMYADMIALGEIMKKIADAIGVAMGNLNLIIVSLHIYEEDRRKVNELLKA